MIQSCAISGMEWHGLEYVVITVEVCASGEETMAAADDDDGGSGCVV